MKRRIRTSVFTILAAILATFTSCGTSGPENKIGIQLYSVRDAMEEDPAGTIEKLGAIGYDFVESAGYDDGKIYGMEPSAFRALVEKNGMVYLGAHSKKAIPDSASWETVMPWWDQCIAAHKEAGAEYIVQPSMQPSAFASLEGLAEYCAYFNAIGEKCNAAGLMFGFHNHDGEFQELEGEVIYDYMLLNTNPEYVMFQMDIYWVYKGGADPLEYFKAYPGRFASFHIKDEKELGESGEIDFMPLLEKADQAGAKYHVVEVERYNHEPIVSVEKSFEYLQEIGFIQ